MFGPFPPVSTEEWEKKIVEDLKGADYQRKLISKTLEGIDLKPYYRSEALEENPLYQMDGQPGLFPYVRGNKISNNDWEIRQDIFLDNIEVANNKALFIQNKGLNGIGFNLEKHKTEDIIKSVDDLKRLLKGIDPALMHLHFLPFKDDGSSILYFLNKMMNGDETARFRGSLNADFLGFLTLTGNFYRDKKEDFNKLHNNLVFAIDNLPGFRILGVNGVYFADAGASIVQELAMTLAQGTEYLSELVELGISVDEIVPRMQFNMGIGSHYFMEIAKIRALRYLWAKIVEQYKPDDLKASDIFVHSVNIELNKTIYDPYLNMLRGTTEAMSAILGGCNSLYIKPFDITYHPPHKFSGRISRNIQIILKEEAFFDQVSDPAAGSYYIETLTNELVEKAWDKFLQIEEQGGYMEAFRKGFIQGEINTSVESRKNDLSLRKAVLIGTNQFPNASENRLDDIDPQFIESRKLETTPGFAEPICRFNLASPFEQLRLRTERSKDKRPVVFLFTYGNVTMRRARASFSSNFFACAGYEIVDHLGFGTLEKGIQEVKTVKPDIVVCCSSDDEYMDIAPKVFDACKDEAIVVVAGYPKESVDELKSRGIQHFIHMKSNILEELTRFSDLLGL